MSDTKQSGSAILLEFRAAMEAKRAARGGSLMPASAGRRMYANARPSRFNVGLGSSGNTSADAELAHSLDRLRAAARQMVRDASFAKRAKTIVVNNIIGPGVGMQAQTKTSRAELNKRVNDDIEAAWAEWCEPRNCHTGGKLHFADLERAAMGQIFEAGEVLIRIHYKAMGSSRVPLALELVEPERLASEFTAPVGPVAPGNEIRMGVEVDQRFQRPQAYWIRERHSGDIRVAVSAGDRFERVDAQDVFHLHVVDRWPQSRGEPWLHTVLRKIDSIDQYTQAELQAAQADAYHFGTIKKQHPTSADGGALANNQHDQAASGAKPEIAIENGMVQELDFGEEFQYHHPTRPNTGAEPFLRFMLREMASGANVSYASLSGDYSQANYSSERVSQLDVRDVWRAFQQWWLRNFRMPLHKLFVRLGAINDALATVPREQYLVNVAKFEAVKFKPRGWNWVDPTKEVAAYKEALKAGLTSHEDVIAQTANGLDIEDVVEAIKRGNELFEAARIERDTDVQASAPATPSPAPPPDDDDDTNNQQDPPRRVFSLAAR